MAGWVKVKSWHIQSGLVSRSGRVHTLCGRWAALHAVSAAVLPSGEKSCERCFQLKEQGDQ